MFTVSQLHIDSLYSIYIQCIGRLVKTRLCPMVDGDTSGSNVLIVIRLFVWEVSERVHPFHSCIAADRNSFLCTVDALPVLWSTSKSGYVEDWYKYFTQSHSYLAHYAPLHSGAILACFWWIWGLFNPFPLLGYNLLKGWQTGMESNDL